MCVLKGVVTYRSREHSADVLLDSGADSEYISSAFVHKLGLPIDDTRNRTKWVKIANGTHCQVPGEVSFTLMMGHYRSRITAHVLDLPDFDIILGLTWLQAVNPRINWKTLRIEVEDRGGELYALPPAGIGRYVTTRPHAFLMEMEEPLTVSQTQRMLRDPNVEACIMKIRELPDTGPSVQKPPDTTFTEMLKKLSINVRDLCKSFCDIFEEELPPKLPPTRDHEHTIETGNATPVNLNSYPLSPVHLAEQSQQIATLLRQGLIEESSSPWGFPVLFVKKPGGKWRMCIDYRALNAVTQKNGYPLPRIQECLDLIGQACRLSKIDFTQGYYQMLVAKEDREKTAFNTREGKFQWNVMPFGLCNAPASFQTLMNRILRPFLGKFVVVYLDDIVVFSSSDADHIQHLTQVFEVLRANTLYARPSKCILFASELEFCGHMVGNGVVRPLSSKIETIRDWPIPKNVHDVRVFLGMVTYYRRFIHSFAKIAVPLFDLLKEADAEIRKKKYRTINWTVAADSAFEELKKRLTSSPVLLQPDTQRPFVIWCDASEWAIGCVLLQLEEGSTDSKRLHPVAYDGRKLSPAEINYPVHEKELLAIKYALQTWRIYIDNGHTTTIYTDHESLKYLATMRNPSKRLARWIEEFGEFDLNIQYRKGAEAVVPDAISRRPDFMGEGPRNRAAIIATVRGLDEDDWALHMARLLQDNTPPPEPLRTDIYEQQQHFTVDEEGCLLRKIGDTFSPYISYAFRGDFLERMHSEYGHLGHPGLLGVVTGRGWWSQMEKDVKEYVRICPQCQIAQRSRPGQERELLQTLATNSTELFHRWAIDLIGILPKTPAGNQWIFTAIEYATGWPVTKALPNARAETIARVIHDEITMVFGPPDEILSDNGSNLVGDVLTAYTRLLATKHRVTTPYHPRTNGKVENLNGLLGSILTKLLTNQPTILWDQYLQQATFAARIRIHATTGYSPYFLMFGRNPRIPSDTKLIRPLEYDGDMLQANLERIEKIKHARMIANEKLVEKAIKTQQIRNQLVKDVGFRENQWVLVRAENRNKFEGRWYGPYQIIKKMILGTYLLADPQGNIVANLINGQRLVTANIPDGKTVSQLWNSSKIQGALRKRNIELMEHSPEVAELFAQENADTPSYDELASIPAKEWKKMMKRSGERQVQVGEEVRNQSEPSVEDLDALQQGIREGLQESHAVEDALQEATRVAVELGRTQPAADQVDRPEAVVTLPGEDRTVSDPMEIQMSDELDIGYVKDQPDTTMNDTIPGANAHSDQPREAMDVDDEEEPVETPSATTSTRIPSWKRELAASSEERARTTTPYGLRQRPSKKRLQD